MCARVSTRIEHVHLIQRVSHIQVRQVINSRMWDSRGLYQIFMTRAQSMLLMPLDWIALHEYIHEVMNENCYSVIFLKLQHAEHCYVRQYPKQLCRDFGSHRLYLLNVQPPQNASLSDTGSQIINDGQLI